jgi:hypothetical protein
MQCTTNTSFPAASDLVGTYSEPTKAAVPALVLQPAGLHARSQDRMPLSIGLYEGTGVWEEVLGVRKQGLRLRRAASGQGAL